VLTFRSLSVTIRLKYVEVFKKKRHASPAACAVSKQTHPLKDEIHLVSSPVPLLNDEGSRAGFLQGVKRGVRK
jgi:hypothetical protein